LDIIHVLSGAKSLLLMLSIMLDGIMNLGGAGDRGSVHLHSAAQMTPSPEVWACSEIAPAASKFLLVLVIFGSNLV
jgi:hypothetical protein